MTTDSDRATSPVVATALLVGLTVVLASVIGTATFGVAGDRMPPADHADVDLSASGDRLALTHRAGPSLDARRLRLRITVAGDPLAHQPPVPFFAATGFHAGPTGPFNPAADPIWTAGETATVRVAASNRPRLTPGSRVEVTVYVDDAPVARASTRVSGG